MKCLSPFVGAFFICTPWLCRAEKAVLHFVTYEAPPHISQSLPDQGAAICAIRQTFKKMNFDLELTFAPLKRAKNLAASKDKFSGYFPSSPYDIDQRFVASIPLLESPWVIVERVEKPIRWEKVSDLSKYRGGTVSQYTPPTDIGDLIKAGKIHVEGAPDDLMNLQKLVSKRIDYAFIDATMFEYLRATDVNIKPHSRELRINAKVVGMMPYYMVFKKTPAAQKRLVEFNKKFNKEEFLQLYLACLKKYMTP